MTADKRGKYAGVKLHLDGPESQAILDWAKKFKAGASGTGKFAKAHLAKVADVINELLAEEPDLLSDRTPEQIKAALIKDQTKIEKQLSTIKVGGDWKQVK